MHAMLCEGRCNCDYVVESPKALFEDGIAQRTALVVFSPLRSCVQQGMQIMFSTGLDRADWSGHLRGDMRDRLVGGCHHHDRGSTESSCMYDCPHRTLACCVLWTPELASIRWLRVT